MFDVQVKRIHEYKRQLLACLQIVAHYLRAQARSRRATRVPRAYIFARQGGARLRDGQAAHPAASTTSPRWSTPTRRCAAGCAVVFVPNYGVSLAQSDHPGGRPVASRSRTAGKEASGTSNMKFALNGALTIGTLDGANVEIRDAVGPRELLPVRPDRRRGRARCAPPATTRAAASRAARRSRRRWRCSTSGFFSLGERDRYRPIVDDLRDDDPYMVCADFDAYAAPARRAPPPLTATSATGRAARCYNIAGASRFSSDATIRAVRRRDLEPAAGEDRPRAARAGTVATVASRTLLRAQRWQATPRSSCCESSPCRSARSPAPCGRTW